MDYTRQSLTFKIKKIARYVRLYGVARTRIKVLGQLHMRREFETLPPSSTEFSGRQNVALLGCGNFAFSHIAYYLHKKYGKVIAACMDVHLNRAASMSRQFGIPFYTDDAEAILSDPRIKLVYIASNHASHAEYAIRALEQGKSVYIEKPHVVNEDQLARLARAMHDAPGRVFLGFNRPGSKFGRLILEHLGREQGPGMYNWFVAGHAIEPEHWYFKPEEGGRVLGNLCHWTDFVLRMAPGAQFPVEITPTRGRKSDSDIAVTYTFPDETIAVITFSAKGHAFEGVKETLSAHRGNCLIVMADYKEMTIDVLDRKRRYVNLFRDHGHARNIVNAYDSVMNGRAYDATVTHDYIFNTAWLFLKTKQALEENRALTADAYGLATAEVQSGGR